MSSVRTLGRMLAASALLAAPLVGARAADEGEKIYASSCTGCHTAKTRPLEGIRLTREK